MKLLSSARGQDTHSRFQLRGMTAERSFHDASPFLSEVQNLRTPVTGGRATLYEALFLQAINGSGHRAAG